MMKERTMTVHAEIERHGPHPYPPTYPPRRTATRTTEDVVVYVMAGKKCLQQRSFLSRQFAEEWLAREWQLVAKDEP